MNRINYILIVVVLCIANGCNNPNKEPSKATDRLVNQEPDIETAKFERIVADKAEEKTADANRVSEESKRIETEKKAAETPVKPKTISPSKQKKAATKRKKAPKFAKIEFDSIVHRLPQVTEGDKFKDEFHFKNTGDIPLTISFATASCGCTLPSYPFLDIAPGDSDVIRVEYNSVGKDGPQEAEITVTANTYPKETILKMIFDVNQKEKITVDTTEQE